MVPPELHSEPLYHSNIALTQQVRCIWCIKALVAHSEVVSFFTHWEHNYSQVAFSLSSLMRSLPHQQINIFIFDIIPLLQKFVNLVIKKYVYKTAYTNTIISGSTDKNIKSAKKIYDFPLKINLC
ncbi:MAG: hypothetical protein RR710_00730 [Oscillospiraceae bacterium]